MPWLKKIILAIGVSRRMVVDLKAIWFDLFCFLFDFSNGFWFSKISPFDFSNVFFNSQNFSVWFLKCFFYFQNFSVWFLKLITPALI